MHYFQQNLNNDNLMTKHINYFFYIIINKLLLFNYNIFFFVSLDKFKNLCVPFLK